MAAFAPVDGNNKLNWREGIYTNESNTHVPVWNHKILIEKIDDNHANYTDIVDIDAGWKTVFIYLWAVCFYSHRQKSG